MTVAHEIFLRLPTRIGCLASRRMGAEGGRVAQRAEERELPDRTSEREALEGLYAREAPALRRHCLSLTRDAARAEDLMSQTFLRFLERVGSPPDGMNVAGYLYATARNLRWSELRASREPDAGADQASLVHDDALERDPERAMLLDDQRRTLRRAAEGLSDRQRRALWLRELEGRSYAEIGAELGIGPDAAGHLLARARQSLRVSFRRQLGSVSTLSDGCGAMLSSLADYVEGGGRREPAGQLRAHLASCRGCRRTLAAYQEAGTPLRGGVPLLSLSSLVLRLQALVGGGSDAPALLARVGAVAAAAAALGGGGIVVSHALAGSPAPKASSPPPLSHQRVGIPATPVAGSARKGSVIVLAHGGRLAPPAGGATHKPARSAHAVPSAQPASPAATPAAGTPPLQATTPVAASTPSVTTDPPRTATQTTPTTSSTSRPTAKPTTTPIRVATPPISTPEVKTPEVKTPEVKTPAITTPRVSLPSLSVPSITVPSITVPQVAVPAVTLPAVVAPALGLASGFSVLGGAGVTQTAGTRLDAALGSFPTGTLSGVLSLVPSLTHSADQTAEQAQEDVATAYAAAQAAPSSAAITGDLGGQTLGPGVYRAGSAIGLTGTLTLDARGDSSAIFIFQAPAGLTLAPGSRVELAGGAQACHVFWQVGDSATVGAGAVLRGTILALGSISIGHGAAIEGRALAHSGAISLDHATVTQPGC
jgi:RNA polymerase sigma factor (sigma-70 family)